MISQITIKNFKSYREATLKLAPLTLLIGANASGKSNVIEAIRFLSWLAHGRRLDDIGQFVDSADIHIRGTLSDLVYDQSDFNELEFGAQLSDTKKWKQFSITLQVQPDGGMRVIKESLRREYSKVPLYTIKAPAVGSSHEVLVVYDNMARGGKKPSLYCRDQQAIFTQLNIPSRFSSRSESTKELQRIIPEIATNLQANFTKILFLDPVPSRMVDYNFINDHELKMDGSNTSKVLYKLCDTDKGKAAVLNFIRRLPEKDILDIDFIKTPRNEVMLRLEESFGQRNSKRDVTLLSDGTLRVLAITAALLSADEGSLVIVEEIDNGIHPSRAKMLLDKIEQVATERNLHVLLTSHNPALLDTLPISAIPHVVACYRDPDKGDSRLIQLQDLLEYPSLVAQGPLGQLMTQGVLDRYLKSQRTKEEKKAANREWLAAFKARQEQAA